MEQFTQGHTANAVAKTKLELGPTSPVASPATRRNRPIRNEDGGRTAGCHRAGAPSQISHQPAGPCDWQYQPDRQGSWCCLYTRKGRYHRPSWLLAQQVSRKGRLPLGDTLELCTGYNVTGPLVGKSRSPLGKSQVDKGRSGKCGGAMLISLNR